MRRIALPVLVAAACGGTSKHDTLPPMPPDPQVKADEPKPPAPEPKPAEPPPPPPKGPVDVTVAAPKVTVKLVAPGKGKRARLKLTPKPGGKQTVELAIDVSQRAEVGGKKDTQTLPTVVFSGDAEVKDVDKDGGAAYVLTVSTIDTRDVGSTMPAADAAKFKQALSALEGVTIGSTIAANGIGGDVKLHLDNADQTARGLLPVFQVALPAWPVLPSEPIGVGAKWQVVSASKAINDNVDVTVTTDYELVKHKGATWTIKGTTKVTGSDQTLGDAQVSKISGDGAIEVALVDGALYPAMKASLSTAFVASGKDGVVSVGITRGTTVTPK